MERSSRIRARRRDGISAVDGRCLVTQAYLRVLEGGLRCPSVKLIWESRGGRIGKGEYCAKPKGSMSVRMERGWVRWWRYGNLAESTKVGGSSGEGMGKKDCVRLHLLVREKERSLVENKRSFKALCNTLSQGEMEKTSRIEADVASLHTQHRNAAIATVRVQSPPVAEMCAQT